MNRHRIVIGLLLLLACAVPARAQLQQTTVSGVVYNPSGGVSTSGTLTLYEARKSGAVILRGPITYRVNSSGQLLDSDGTTVGAKWPRNSTVRVFANAPGLNSCANFAACSASASNGVWLTVPDSATASLESLVAVTLVPATFGNPMTTAGDLIVGSTGGVATRLAKGSNGQVLTVTGGSVVWGSSSGTGTVTDFSAGNLSPIFTSSVATSTTTPALSFTLSSQSANRIFAGPTTGSAAAPTFRALVAADVPDLSGTYAAASHTHAQGDVTGLVAALAAKQDALGFTPVPNTRTVNGHALSGDVTVTPADLSLVIGTNVQAWDADLDTWATKTAPSGTVVGTSDTQSLTNKKLGSLTGNGFVKTSGGDGTLSVDTATYLTAETDPVVKALNGIVKSNGTTLGVVTIGSGLSYDGTTLSASGGSGATAALDNLASVAINTALLPGTDNSIALGSSSKRWTNLFLSGFLGDGSGNELLKFSATASAVNELTIANAATGNKPEIAASGGDTNIGFKLTPKGTGAVDVVGDGSVATIYLNIYDRTTRLWKLGTSISSNDDLLVMQSNIINLGAGYLHLTGASSTAQIKSFNSLYLRPASLGGSGQVEIDNGVAGRWSGLKLGSYDAGTNTVTNGLTVAHRSSGTPAAGLGAAILFNLDSTTNTDRNAAQIGALWNTATDASRSADVVVYTVNNAAAFAEAVRVPSYGGIRPKSVTFATLPGSPSEGDMIFCSDCAAASSPCTGSGSGAMAFRQGSAWKCF